MQLTHENITAGVAATINLLPASNGISNLDTVVSGHSLSSAYGRTVAYAALYENASFATLDSSKIFGGADGLTSSVQTGLDDLKSLETYPLPSLTILFGRPELLVALASNLAASAKGFGLMHRLANRHKISALVWNFFYRKLDHPPDLLLV